MRLFTVQFAQVCATICLLIFATAPRAETLVFDDTGKPMYDYNVVITQAVQEYVCLLDDCSMFGPPPAEAIDMLSDPAGEVGTFRFKPEGTLAQGWLTLNGREISFIDGIQGDLFDSGWAQWTDGLYRNDRPIDPTVSERDRLLAPLSYGVGQMMAWNGSEGRMTFFQDKSISSPYRFTRTSTFHLVQTPTVPVSATSGLLLTACAVLAGLGLRRRSL